jgi:hypothetical protein
MSQPARCKICERPSCAVGVFLLLVAKADYAARAIQFQAFSRACPKTSGPEPGAGAALLSLDRSDFRDLEFSGFRALS